MSRDSYLIPEKFSQMSQMKQIEHTEVILPNTTDSHVAQVE
jgi:hypothetical protein